MQLFRKLIIAGSLGTLLATGLLLTNAHADLDFRGTISGDPLDFTGETESPQFKEFKNTGVNPYNGDQEAMNKGYVIFATACSGCHGHLAEGKLGPALSDDYWTYPGNRQDKGLFETIYGGADGQMGPQQGLLEPDEILHVMSWVRGWQTEPAKTKKAVEAYEKRNG